MSTKPILFWPKAQSDIATHLDRSGDDFLVVDTNSTYELQKLYKIRSDTPIFDPFPEHGEHYRHFIDHVASVDSRCHIVGIKACRDVLEALKDPLVARSPIEEVFAVIKPTVGSSSRRPIAADWSRLNPVNTMLLAILVFAATLTGVLASPHNSLLAALTAACVFAVLYVCLRANFSKSFSSIAGQLNVVVRKRRAY
jgi:hypothetical protein